MEHLWQTPGSAPISILSMCRKFTGIMIYFLAEKSGMLDGESTVILSVFGVIGDIAVDMISLLVAVGMAAVSYLCSCRIMKKKEL